MPTTPVLPLPYTLNPPTVQAVQWTGAGANVSANVQTVAAAQAGGVSVVLTPAQQAVQDTLGVLVLQLANVDVQPYQILNPGDYIVTNAAGFTYVVPQATFTARYTQQQ